MESVTSALEHLVHVSTSGTDHPYYAVVHPLRGKPDNMFVRITSDPPLGRETTISRKKDLVTFNAYVQAENLDEHWEIDLWHGDTQNLTSCKSVPFIRGLDQFYICGTPSETAYRPKHSQWYVATLQRPAKGDANCIIPFTIRFRRHSQDSWKWVQDQSGAPDGRLIFQTSAEMDSDLSHYIHNLDPHLQIEKVSDTEVPETLLWSVTGTANTATGETPGSTQYSFGLPIGFVRWFALVRLWSPWLAPRQGKATPLAEKDAVLYSFLRDDGLHVVMLAISGVEFIQTTFRYESEQIIIHAQNDAQLGGTARVVVAVGADFDIACAATVYYARQIIRRNGTTRSDLPEVRDKQLERTHDMKATWIRNWYDGFTYCTWNGLGQNLTEEKISGALESLEKHGIRITNLIIDDNWQSLDRDGESQMVRGWKDFEANSEGFPEGLKRAVMNIRQKYPAIAHIAVWHALLGYWGGISPNGKIAKDYQTLEIVKRKSSFGSNMLVVDTPDVEKFYNNFYGFLAAAGIDAVKTDAQFFLDEFASAPVRKSLTMTYLNAWLAAQSRHFGGNAISCMSQTPTILFHSQLPTWGLPPIVVRNSDDFFPDVEASHPWHIFCNAHNSLFTRYLNVLPDWDMFQTSHPWAGFHAAARCVSGGPIYITDTPGKHDVDLIKQMTAQTSRDQTIILRPSVVGRSTSIYIGYEEEHLCKVGAYDGAAETGSAFLGIFNCTKNDITEVVPLTQFPGTNCTEGNARQYVVRSHRTGRVSAPMQAGEAKAVLAIEVYGQDWEVLSACPVTRVQTASSTSLPKPLTIANLGLLGKMTGPAAIISTTISPPTATTASTTASPSPPAAERNRIHINTVLKALGVVGIYLSGLPQLDLERDFMVLLEGQPIPFACVGRCGSCEMVLEVDVERAWKEMGLRGDWSGVVGVDVFVGGE